MNTKIKNMNKIVLIGAAAVVILILGVVIFSNSEGQAALNQKITPEGEILRLTNIDNANLRIITADTDQISVNLEGPEDELTKVRFFTTGYGAEFGFSEEWQNASGTITVPEGMLIEFDVPDDLNSDGDDEIPNFIRLGGGSSYYSVNITDSGVSFNEEENDGDDDQTGDDEQNEDGTEGDGEDEDEDGGEGEGEGESEGEGEDDSPAPPPPPPPDDQDDDEEESDEPQTTLYEGDGSITCSIEIRQEDRNECCEAANVDTPHPECDYDGYWLFNYHTRLCYYHCFHPCNVGSQDERDECCAEQNHYSTTPPCIGNWVFDNLLRSCSYECMSEEELEEFYGDEDGYDTDLISATCSEHNNPDLCCDYHLKNELSIGPRPGFPDCLGRWHLEEGTSLCEFRCASYGEMLEILEELEEQAQ